MTIDRRFSRDIAMVFQNFETLADEIKHIGSND
jgi:hypothetical protein